MTHSVQPPTPLDYFVHESAYVDEGAIVGSGTKIWHFSHVMGKATIGQNCSLGQNVLVANHVIIGDGCKIQNNVLSLRRGYSRRLCLLRAEHGVYQRQNPPQ